MVQIEASLFERSDYLGYFKQVYRRFGWRALDKQFRKTVRRPFSRSLIAKFAPTGVGIEIGVGSQTIAPMSRTVLTDAFSEIAGGQESWARLHFHGAEIPFADGTFNFVLTEHVLEHIADPLKTLAEWKRVLKPGGTLFLFLPHKERTFDKNRTRTTLGHLIDDFKNRIPDSDSTHLDDWIENVIKPGLAPHYTSYSREEMVSNGGIHHHVWVTNDAVEFLKHSGFEVIFEMDEVPDRHDTFVVVGRK